jgi:tetratricopeptide (TPR) repeat protein
MVRRYVRKRTFSTANRVLIHLSTDGLGPGEQTQEGIAAATRSGRSTLTKWLIRMERGSLVARRRIRVPGHPLPKYGYRLSKRGWHAATALRKELESDVVTVRAPSVGEISVRMSEVTRLGSRRFSLTAAVASVRKGRLDLTRVAPAPKTRGAPVWGSGLRRVDLFCGRANELRDLDRWWASDGRTLLVTGLAGIGKSALVAAWVQGRRLKSPVYGFETHRSSTLAGLLDDFGAFLATLGKPALAAHLAQGVPLDPAFVSRLLRRDLRGTRMLAVLDNADQPSRALARLMNRLFVQSEEHIEVKTILLARRVPKWLRRKGSAAGVEILNLQGLDPAASRILLRGKGLGPDSSSAKEIIQRTRGHPLLLLLWAALGTGHGSEVQRYLKEEVWDSLSASDRRTLEAASVFRRPIGGRVLGVVADADPQIAESLAERNLLERTVAGDYGMHDLVREFVLGQVSEPRSRRLHARAADTLLQSTESRERWEGVGHLLEAGRVRDAASLLESEGGPLMDCVAAEEVASLIRGITLDETEPGPYCVFAEALADSLRIRGHLAPALFQYGHARHLAEGSGQDWRIPRLLRKMAFLERCRNRYSKALGYLVEAQGRLAQMKDPAETADVLREMALVEQALGDLPAASVHLSDAIDRATDLPDRAGLSRALLALGSLEAREGRLEEGLNSDLEGLRVAERSGNLTEIAHAHIVVGTALEELGRLEESLHHHEIGLELARLLGNLRLMAYGMMNRTGTLVSLARYKEASGSLQEARQCFEILEEADALALLKTYEAQLQMGLGNWSRAKPVLEEGLQMLRKCGSPADLALALREAGGFYTAHGEPEAGRRCLREARGIALKLGNPKLSSEIAEALSDVGTPPATKPRV